MELGGVLQFLGVDSAVAVHVEHFEGGLNLFWKGFDENLAGGVRPFQRLMLPHPF